MSNYKAITGSSKIVHRNQGGGSKLQGIPSSTNLNTWAHVAFRNRNVVCPCKRNVIFCMNQLGGVGAGGIPGRSYAFAPGADGTHKPNYCGNNFILFNKFAKNCNNIKEGINAGPCLICHNVDGTHAHLINNQLIIKENSKESGHMCDICMKNKGEKHFHNFC